MNDLSSPSPASPRKEIGSQPFSVSARVAMQLGRESISSSVTAILELVKNAYDADASRVRIRFNSLDTDRAILCVEDDGRGMTVDDLRNNWLVIGTSNKATARRTDRGRVLTGEKGLGRLGLDRLCTRTRVQSITKGAQEAIELDIDWTRYEQPTSRLEEIVHTIYGMPNLDQDPLTRAWVKFPHGTRLILEGLKDGWSEESLAGLRDELSLLVSPFAASNQFAIELETGWNNKALDGTISVPEFVLEAAYWKVVGTIADDGMVEIAMSSARHNSEFHLKPVRWGDWLPTCGEKPFCGPLRFEFYFFPRKEAGVGEQMLSRSEVVQFLNANQGIRIYRDGFRVKPYGQPNGDGDWLQLAFRKTRSPEGVAQDATPGAWRLGYHQVVGAVFLTHEKNPALSDQTNREGLLEGKALSHLRMFASKVVRFFEVNHQQFEMSRKRDVAEVPDAMAKAQASVIASDEALDKVSRLLNKIRQPSAQADDALRVSADELSEALADSRESLERVKLTAAASVEAMASETAKVERQKNMLSNLASLGILAAAFGHETVDWSGNVAKFAQELDENVIRSAWWILEAERPELQRTLKYLVSESTKLRKFAKFTLGNLDRRKRKRERFCIRRTLASVFAAFDAVLKEEKRIVPSYPVSGDYWINAFVMDWESIFVNLLINSAWALETTPPDNRKVQVSLSSTTTEHIIEFEDSGRGLEPGTEETIFYPTYTTKRNERGEEIGTGLGLTIVKAFVEENSKGSIVAVQRGALGGAKFTIRVPRVP